MAAEAEAQWPLYCGLWMSCRADLNRVPIKASGSQSASKTQGSDSPIGHFRQKAGQWLGVPNRQELPATIMDMDQP